MSDGKMPDMGALMNMVQKLQGDVARTQEELQARTYEAAAGGGMVTAVVNGKFDLVSINMDKEVVDPEDLDMLQDLVVAAVNAAIEKARETTNQEMAKLTGGLNIPGMPKLF